jgi:hypothetical protein
VHLKKVTTLEPNFILPKDEPILLELKKIFPEKNICEEFLRQIQNEKGAKGNLT